jgi:hypothetical protein
MTKVSKARKAMRKVRINGKKAKLEEKMDDVYDYFSATLLQHDYL